MGRPRADADDIALWAVVTASREQAGGKAALMLSAQARAVHGPDVVAPAETANQWENVLAEIATGKATALYTSAPPDRAIPGLHRWMSDPAAGLAATLELRWRRPWR